MPPTTPYAVVLGDLEPGAAMLASTDRFRTVAGAWTPAEFERSLAPGKWTARQILIHLAQTELALGNRARMALATSNYAAQAFDQDRWMAIESGRSGLSADLSAEARSAKADGLSGADALHALLALVTMNRVLFAALSPADLATPFSHPEYGALTVDWIVHQLAGHQIHHLTQLEAIAAR